ncbi:hypothetical protein [Limnofasciculus baicalensis]|uniref:Uncharacterized protein n=1 Tax=Limnofasciculus baicalensis BBK-W-15 TaxID=2699891 RepID=A0AAE3KN54_9CYAN|nr:hypothetical protein [Limnofasciculus baicalensis]MCP2729959.1 hypothetical protein [Limnofasciculus baicalensis BBK-W-15]
MRILIAYPVDEDVLLAILNDNVIYRPDLQTKGSRFVTKALTELRPDVLIAQELPDEQAVQSWVSATPKSARFIVQKGNIHQDGEARQSWFAGVPVFTTALNDRIHPDIQPLSVAERVHTERLVWGGDYTLRVSFLKVKKHLLCSSVRALSIL